jgi:hypothetical protein
VILWIWRCCQLVDKFTVEAWRTILFNGSEGTKIAARCTNYTCTLSACLRLSTAISVLPHSPTIAARSRIQKFSKYEKTRPDKIMSPEPANNMRLLPTRSAIMVKKIPKKTSPSSVSVMKRPIWKSVNFSSAKNKAGWDQFSIRSPWQSRHLT